MTKNTNSKTSCNRFGKAAAKMVTAVLTAAFVVQAAAQATEIQAATHTANRMLEMPVSFQTDRTYDSSAVFSDYWSVAQTFTSNGGSLTFLCNGTDLTPDSRISYTVYIPSDYFENDDSVVVFSMGVTVIDPEASKFTKLWGSEGAYLVVSPDGVNFRSFDGNTEKYDQEFTAKLEKEGNFYVLKVNSKVDFYGDQSSKYTKSGASGMNVKTIFAPSILGFSMDAPDGNVYIDEVTFTSASGETLYTQDFEDADDVMGIWANIYDGEGEYTYTTTLNVETIYDNELFTVLKSKVSVKKGKKKSLSSYVNAVSTDDVTYKSSNKKVATVTSKGVVKGKKKGTATITVTANGVKKKIKVTVK